MLTSEQQKIVEDNHSLIYWAINKLTLNVEDWYDLFAIELCMSVLSYNESKGALSTYYISRCSNMVSNEISKTKSQKNPDRNTIPLDTIYNVSCKNTVDSDIQWDTIFELDVKGILRMKADGYTQSEIADKLGMSQAYVSSTINKIKREYERRYL